jgi:hypothetical protein
MEHSMPKANSRPCIVLNPLEKVALERASPKVRRILEMIATLSVEEQKELPTWLHNFLPHEWVIMERSFFEEEMRALRRMTNMAMKFGRRENRGKNPNRNRKIIELYQDGRTAGQIVDIFRDKYPQWMTMRNGKELNRAAVQSVIDSWNRKQRRPA